MTADAINVLWLVSEDCPPRGSAYGDSLIATPNIDRLAERGVLFENAFSTYPVCAPSRFSLITGMEPASSGPAHHMRAMAKVPSDFKTYAELFRSAG
jgi:arylsulfatase A-like enzyme